MIADNEYNENGETPENETESWNDYINEIETMIDAEQFDAHLSNIAITVSNYFRRLEDEGLPPTLVGALTRDTNSMILGALLSGGRQ